MFAVEAFPFQGKWWHYYPDQEHQVYCRNADRSYNQVSKPSHSYSHSYPQNLHHSQTRNTRFTAEMPSPATAKQVSRRMVIPRTSIYRYSAGTFLAPLKSAPIAPSSLASIRLASIRLAPIRSAFVRSASSGWHTPDWHSSGWHGTDW